MENLNRKFLSANPEISGVKIGSLATNYPEKVIQFGEVTF